MPELMQLDRTARTVVAAKRAENALFELHQLFPEEHWIALPEQDLRMRVLVWGKGEPLVVVPGNTGDVFPLIPLLANMTNRRIIAINRPGGGMSDGMDHNTVDIHQFAVTVINTTFEHFGLKNSDIISHSMGAHWSLLFTRAKPEKVRRLVLLANPGNLPFTTLPKAFALLKYTWLSRLLFKLIRPKNEQKGLRILSQMGHSQQTLDSLSAPFRECYFRFRYLPNAEISTISLIQNMPDVIDTTFCQSIPVQTLLVLGTNDNFLSVSDGQTFVQRFPQGSLCLIENAGHLPWLENPQHCATEVIKFLI